MAGWFGADHYYKVEDTWICKGKPWTEGDFTVFICVPSGKELRIKTKLISMIEDLGTAAPTPTPDRYDIYDRIIPPGR